MTGPRFAQTVPRELVHKWALTEVFLTDYAALDEHRYLCAAQLPTSHAYFNDDATGGGVVDPLAILEATRQAVTYGAHVFSGVAASAVFVLTAFRLDLSGPVAAADTAGPAELVAVTTVSERAARAGRPSSRSYATELSRSGVAIGTASMDVTCLASDQYRALRRMGRGGEPPTAFDAAGPVVGDPVDPARVHRFQPRNVVIRGYTATGRRAGAFLDPGCYRNRSMFDHPYDHVPAMVLTEAARQLLLVAAGAGAARVRGLAGRFAAFAELDSPVRLDAAPAGGAGPIEVVLTQAGRPVAEISVTVE